MNHITENEFITGIADGTYTPNDAVAYCQQCFDKVGFLDRLYVYSFLECNYNDRERDLIRKAKDVVYCYLLKEGYKFSHEYEVKFIENNGINSKMQNGKHFGEISQDEQEAAIKSILSNYPEVATDRAIKYFARALSANQKYMFYRLDGTGFEWRQQQIRLGYFCSKVFEQPRPIKALEIIFDVSKLDASITQASYEPKRADVIKWRAEIDNDIFFD